MGATENNVFHVGLWILAASVVVPLMSVILATFITRREFEKLDQENNRRMASNETLISNVTERIENVRVEAADALRQSMTDARGDRDVLSEKLSRYVAELHTKINGVDKSVTGLEVEIRHQGKTISAIAHRLNVTVE